MRGLKPSRADIEAVLRSVPATHMKPGTHMQVAPYSPWTSTDWSASMRMFC